MIISAKSGLRGVLVDLDRNERIPFAYWADVPEDSQQLGEYEAFYVGADGKPLRNEAGIPQRYRRRARIKFVAGKTIQPPTPLTPSLHADPACVVITPKVTSPPRAGGPRGVPVGLFEDCMCERYACLRPADWKVADEVELSPVVGLDGKRYETAETVGVRYYCSWHFERPRLLDSKGEIIKEIEVKARPQ